MTAWVDSYGKLMRGKHKGRDVAVLAIEEPSYLRWVLSETAIDDEDANVIRWHLASRGELNDD